MLYKLASSLQNQTSDYIKTQPSDTSVTISSSVPSAQFKFSIELTNTDNTVQWFCDKNMVSTELTLVSEFDGPTHYGAPFYCKIFNN
jgi:hypothetical protein